MTVHYTASGEVDKWDRSNSGYFPTEAKFDGLSKITFWLFWIALVGLLIFVLTHTNEIRAALGY